MKPRLFLNERIRWHWASLLALCGAFSSVSAAETNAPAAKPPAQLTPEQLFEGGATSYNNWIDISAGGFINSGNNAQFQQNHRTSGNAFGGIEDLHYEKEISKGTTLSLDGRSILDNHDYGFGFGITREKFGYFRISYSDFRTWYNGDGGFYRPASAWYPLSD